MPKAVASREYRGFVSYSHEDKQWAKWLVRKLEGYRTPKRLVGRVATDGIIPAKLSPIFRDTEELTSSADLGGELKNILSHSASLIVVCSPAAAASKWVDREIALFKEMGKGNKIYCFVVDGDIDTASENCCFPPAIVESENATRGLEPLAADARSGNKKKAIQKLTAALLGVGLDELRQRELQRRNRRLFAVSILTSIGMIFTIALASIAFYARQEAVDRRQQAESLLTFMIGDLRDSLEPIGRLDLLEKVTSEAMIYFTEVDENAISDQELLHQVEILTQIGNIRLARFNYTEALQAFKEGRDRSDRLFSLHPQQGEYLFQRSQAEFYIGLCYWRLKNLDAARKWLTQYLTSSYALVELDPSNKDSRMEVIFALHNLGVIETDAHNYLRAIDVFSEELKGLEANVEDPTLNEYVADVQSWLGTSQQALGELQKTKLHLQNSLRIRVDRLAQDPRDKHRELWVGVAESHLGRLLLLKGEFENGVMLLEDSVQRINSLISHDPENMMWLRYYVVVATDLLQTMLGDSDQEDFDDLLQETLEKLELLISHQPNDRDVLLTKIRLSRLSSQAIFTQENLSLKTEALFAETLTLAKKLYTEQPNNLSVVEELVRVRLLGYKLESNKLNSKQGEKYLLPAAEDVQYLISKNSKNLSYIDLSRQIEYLRGNFDITGVFEKQLDDAGYHYQITPRKTSGER